jgi:probable rRNA maturation factor
MRAAASRRGSVTISCTGIRTPSWIALLQEYCLRALQAMGGPGWDVSVLLCDDRTMAGLNLRYRRRSGPTDVLSFRQDDGGGPPAGRTVGDIVISLETVRRNAEERGEPAGMELGRIAVHGLLHLAGMDHGRGAGGEMLELQELMLTELGPLAVMTRRGGRLGRGRLS